MHLSTTADTLRIMILAIDDTCVSFKLGIFPAMYCPLLTLFCKGHKTFSPLKHLPCSNKSLIIVRSKKSRRSRLFFMPVGSLRALFQSR